MILFALIKDWLSKLMGGQHNEDMHIEKDNVRTKWLEKEGYRVIRFWNKNVLTNIEGVAYRIRREALE